MMTSDAMSVEDQQIAEMKEAREGRGVLKYDLIIFRGDFPEGNIFVFEGNDDKIVYSHWVRRVMPYLQYEPFVCKGKENVLLLKDVTSSDAGELDKDIYFFVDRDFDDLRGHSSAENLFMTDQYSVENYLVSELVLDDLLKNEFQCHGQINVRNKACAHFKADYDDFLAITKELNRRLYVSRKLKVKISGGLPDKIGEIALVQILGIASPVRSPEELVKFALPIAHLDFIRYSEEFEELDPKKRYRGKFALLFFLRWLQNLTLDYNSDASLIFSEVEAKGKARNEEFVLGNLAAKASLPNEFENFLNSVKRKIL